jgi:serine/threonine protein kinase
MDRSIQYGTREGFTAFCLGRPPHVVQAEEVICRICGAVVAGAQLGVYQVHQCLGQGRSGSAYLAVHIRSRQQVVVKLFPADPMSRALWEAARREVRVVTALRHPSILPVFSCTAWNPLANTGRLVRENTPLSIEYLLTLCQYASGSLSDYIAYHEQQRTPRMLARLIHLIKQMGAALTVAHERGIVHGALVPGNILVDENDHLWIADFGLARLHPPMAPFLAPELLAANQPGNASAYWNAVTPTSDQYALAVLCEQLLTRLLRATEYEPALPVLQCATSQRPARRFASVDIFVHELVAQLMHGYAEVPEKQTDPSSMRFTPYPPRLGTTEPNRYDRMMNYRLSSSGLQQDEDWEKRGDKLFTLRDYVGAVAAYQQALELDNGRSSTWLALGDAFLALEDYTEALRAYEHAVKLNPNDPLAWSNRGTALDALGRHKEAMGCYERASELS